jgi:SAM-dependent methyltransferase
MMTTDLRERTTATLRYYARRSLYASPFSASLVRAAAPRLTNPERPESPDYFTGKRAAYLQPTFSITARNALTASLLKMFAPCVSSLWDIGCARGTLAAAMAPVGCDWYLGSDINTAAVEAAESSRDAQPGLYPGHTQFQVGSMGTCRPTRDAPLDVIVFNEVIYYLPTVRDAAAELVRAAHWLAPGGVLCISLKDDPKSHAILRLMPRRFTYLHSALFQEQVGRPSFRVRINRQRPAYLISLFSNSSSG